MSVNRLTSYKVGFKSAEIKEQSDQQQRYFEDAVLYGFASAGPQKNVMKSSKKTLGTILLGVPLVDSILNSAMQAGPLSSKLTSTAGNLGRWGGIIATAFVVSGVKKTVNSNIEKLDNFDKKHPFLSLGVDILAIGATYSALSDFGVKVASNFKKVLPTNFIDKANSAKNSIKEFLNKSFVNTKIVDKMDALFATNPTARAIGTTVAVLAAPVIAIAALIKFNKNVNQAVQQADNNFTFLKSINDATKKIAAEE